MLDIIKEINNFGWSNVVLCVVIFCSLVVSIKVGWDKLLIALGLRSEASVKEEKLNNRLNQMQSDIDTLNQKVKNIADDTFRKQETLMESQNNIKDSIEQLKEEIMNLTQATNDIQNRNDSKERAKLKDRIAQAYRYYHRELKWSEMDREAFKDLIKAYEQSGGSNSFVHSICEPESETWEII